MTLPTLPLKDIDDRAREIFRRLVESYLETGEPVGSRSLSKTLALQLSPASIRNVMQDLEEAGLIYAPHVSAGRLPTQTGLRFFVDALMEVGDLTADERSAIDSRVAAEGGGRSPEEVLTEASQMLSGLSRGAGVVLAAKSDVRLRHIEFVRLEPAKGLVVLVGEDGSVENRLVELPPDFPPSALTEAANFLNGTARGRTLEEARRELERRQAERQAELDQLTAKVVDEGFATWAGAGGGRPSQLIVRGRSNLLDDVRAVEDLERIRVLFDDLERNREILQLVGDAEAGEGVRIFIGSETKLFSLSGSSMIISPYRDKESRVIGALGVIGPTRLNYARVIPMVDYTAKLVGRLLG